MITSETETIELRNMRSIFRYSLQNLTTEYEHLSDDLDELKEFLENDDSGHDFLFWDNENNCDIYVQMD